MQTTTTTTETTTKRWYALVRLDEDGRSVAPQAEEIAKLERELMRSQEVSTGGGHVNASISHHHHHHHHHVETFLHTTYSEGGGEGGRMMQQQDENDVTATKVPSSRLGGGKGGGGRQLQQGANSDGTESAKEGSQSPSTTNETTNSSGKKRKKDTNGGGGVSSGKEKKKENATDTDTNNNNNNNRGGEESARGTNARELPPGCKPGGPCDHCGALDSPQWRRGPASKPCLCNACGTRFRRTNFLAPLSNNKDKQDNDEDNAVPTGNDNNKRNLDGGSNMASQTTKKRLAAAC